jgi:uncharacterized protein YjeT (DUF2065 family)
LGQRSSVINHTSVHPGRGEHARIYGSLFSGLHALAAGLIPSLVPDQPQKLARAVTESSGHNFRRYSSLIVT